MTCRRRLEVISNADGIDAVLGERTDGGEREGMSWAGSLAALSAFGVGCRLHAPHAALFDAELTARWGRLVACTPEFSAWWRARADAAAPTPNFSLEIHYATP